MKPFIRLTTTVGLAVMLLAGGSAAAQTTTSRLAQTQTAAAPAPAAPAPASVKTTTRADTGTAFTVADRRNVEPPFTGPCYRGLVQAPCSTPGPSVQVDLLKKKPSWSMLVGVPKIR